MSNDTELGYAIRAIESLVEEHGVDRKVCWATVKNAAKRQGMSTDCQNVGRAMYAQGRADTLEYVEKELQAAKLNRPIAFEIPTNAMINESIKNLANIKKET